MTKDRPVERRLVFVQYGNYREAVLRFAEGGGETYYAQRYSVDAVGALVGPGRSVSMVGLRQEGVCDELLPNGVRCIQLRGVHYERAGARELGECIEALRPTDLILSAPATDVVLRVAGIGGRILLMLADSFEPTWRHWFRHWRLRRALDLSAVEYVGNHNYPASESLAGIGVPKAKILPWDWPLALRPEETPVKSAPAPGEPKRLIFVGVLSELKGTGDSIRALAHLRKRDASYRLTVVGGGDPAPFRTLAEELGVVDAVDFAGRIPHSEVMERMRQHQLVLVPSRHEYPEGLPMTIYDAFGSRTPLVLSDHPMFCRRVAPEDAVWFKASRPEELARAVASLFADPARYRDLSENASSALESIECPAKWGEVVSRWVRNEPEDREWLSSQTLARRRDTVEAR